MSITRIEVDFNDRDESGLIPASIADADGPLAPAAWVDAFDDEGYHCLATVGTLTDELVTLEPAWATLAEPRASRLLVLGARYQGPLSVTVFFASEVHVTERSAHSVS